MDKIKLSLNILLVLSIASLIAIILVNKKTIESLNTYEFNDNIDILRNVIWANYVLTTICIVIVLTVIIVKKYYNVYSWTVLLGILFILLNTGLTIYEQYLLKDEETINREKLNNIYIINSVISILFFILFSQLINISDKILNVNIQNIDKNIDKNISGSVYSDDKKNKYEDKKYNKYEEDDDENKRDIVYYKNKMMGDDMNNNDKFEYIIGGKLNDNIKNKNDEFEIEFDMNDKDIKEIKNNNGKDTKNKYKKDNKDNKDNNGKDTKNNISNKNIDEIVNNILSNSKNNDYLEELLSNKKEPKLDYLNKSKNQDKKMYKNDLD
jgi:hypothetical protein